MNTYNNKKMLEILNKGSTEDLWALAMNKNITQDIYDGLLDICRRNKTKKEKDWPHLVMSLISNVSYKENILGIYKEFNDSIEISEFIVCRELTDKERYYIIEDIINKKLYTLLELAIKHGNFDGRFIKSIKKEKVLMIVRDNIHLVKGMKEKDMFELLKKLGENKGVLADCLNEEYKALLSL